MKNTHYIPFKIFIYLLILQNWGLDSGSHACQAGIVCHLIQVPSLFALVIFWIGACIFSQLEWTMIFLLCLLHG
jgi:hypothetical protein